VVCRELADLARCAVASVDHRLAPSTVPAAVDDAVAATRWVAREAGRLGIDARRIAVGGDSAGGNLAAVVALVARDEGGPPLAMQTLIYPATDMAADTPSHLRYAEGTCSPATRSSGSGELPARRRTRPTGAPRP
jgi:acetyl esterase